MYYIETEEGIEINEELVSATMDAYLNYYGEERDFSINFISDEEIQIMNKEYRGMDNPTDILSFAFNDGEEFSIIYDEEEEMPEEELGDIFISLDSMRRNAETFGVGEEEELKRLLLHGLLHLRGGDHATNDFAVEPMLQEQERVLQELGFKG